MPNTKHEDAIMKMGLRFFRDQILKLLTFLTTEDFYIHVEFQTTDSGEEDLQRFHAYESVFSNETGKKVVTYVIYSGGIINTKNTLDCGMYDYKVMPIYLTQKNADEIFKYLQKKKETGEEFTEEDFARLSLTPLMASRQEKKDTIKAAILLTKQDNSDVAEKTMAILYTLADKFLQGNDLEEIKEVVAMTRLGQMLYDDGVKAGEEKGRLEGKHEGRHEGSERMAALTKILLDNDKITDLQLALDDSKYREALMEEYKIK